MADFLQTSPCLAPVRAGHSGACLAKLHKQQDERLAGPRGYEALLPEVFLPSVTSPTYISKLLHFSLIAHLTG